MTLLRSELIKILFQKRNYIGWVALLVIPVVMAFALNFGQQPDGGPASEGEGAQLFDLAMGNGLLMPLAAMNLLMFFLVLVASMVGSYQLSGEAESSTLKTWLLLPVDRGPVVVSKWFAAVLSMFAGLGLTALAAYGAGIPFFGAGRIALLSGETVSVAHGLGLTALAYLYVGLALVAVVSLAMLISAATNSSLAAAIGTLVAIVVLPAVGQLSYFEFLQPYFLSSHLEGWVTFFQGAIDWATVWEGVLTFAAYAAVGLVATWLLFRRKDVLV